MDNEKLEQAAADSTNALYSTIQLKRIADAIEEILRIVKKDMEPRTKKKIREESDEEIEEEARLKDGDDELSWSK